MENQKDNLDERKYCVYMHKNLVNEKYYFGLTCQKPEYRWGRGSAYKNNKPFYEDIKTFGWDNFLHKVLVSDISRSDAKQLEQKLIAEFNSTDSKFGYNKTLGGEGHLKYKTEAERYQALREQKNKSQQKLRQNPKFREKERQYAKQYRLENKDNSKLAINSTEKRKQYFANYISNSDNYEKYRTTHKQCNKKIYREVELLRSQLKDLFNRYPDCFTPEQIEASFGRKNRNYMVNSKVILNDIYEKVYSQIIFADSTETLHKESDLFEYNS